MKQRHIFLFLVLFFISHFSFAENSEYGSCSYACKRIPEANQVLHFAGHSTLTTLSSTRLNVLVWNIYKGRMQDFRHDFSLLAKSRDLILLSEATTGEPITSTLQQLPGAAWQLAAGFEMKDQIATGTALVSKVDAYNVHYYRTTDVEPLVKSPKAMIVAEYLIPGSSQSLLAVSIHGINWSGDEALVRQLNMILPELKSHQGPILFAGDFNIKNSNRLEITKQILGQAGLTRVPWENPNSKKQLDDAFVRGLSVKRARLINDYVGTASDHPAIDLQLEIKP